MSEIFPISDLSSDRRTRSAFPMMGPNDGLGIINLENTVFVYKGKYISGKGIAIALGLAEPDPEPTKRFQDVIGCLRCGQHHQHLEFTPMANKDSKGENYWATCPTTGMPILTRLE